MTMWRSILAAAIAAPLAIAAVAAVPGTARAETQGIVAVANDRPITERDITQRIELRKILGGLDALVLTRPEVFISLCQTRFDAEGKLVDAPARKAVADQMLAFERWIERMAPRS